MIEADLQKHAAEETTHLVELLVDRHGHDTLLDLCCGDVSSLYLSINSASNMIYRHAFGTVVGTPDDRTADFGLVGLFHECLAQRAAIDHLPVESMAACRGALTCAVEARQPHRALALAKHYLDRAPDLISYLRADIFKAIQLIRQTPRYP